RYLSDDAQWMTFSGQTASSSTNYSVFARKTDGSPAVRLGDADSTDLSSDGKWALGYLPSDPHMLLLIPLGAGETRTLKSETLHYSIRVGAFMPDGKSVLISAEEKGHGQRVYLQAVAGGEPKPVTPEGFSLVLAGPDNKRFLAQDLQ